MENALTGTVAIGIGAFMFTFMFLFALVCSSFLSAVISSVCDVIGKRGEK